MCIKGSVKTKPDYPIVNCRGRVCLPEDTKQTVFGRANLAPIWGIERSGFFNGREKWAKGFENQRV